MEVLGFSGEDQDSIFRILASILHLGNVYFEKYEVREPTAGLGPWYPQDTEHLLRGCISFVPSPVPRPHHWGCSSSY